MDGPLDKAILGSQETITCLAILQRSVRDLLKQGAGHGLNLERSRFLQAARLFCFSSPAISNDWH